MNIQLLIKNLYFFIFYLSLVLGLNHCKAEPDNSFWFERDEENVREDEEEPLKSEQGVTFEQIKSMTSEEIRSLDDKAILQFQDLHNWRFEELTFEQLSELFYQIHLHGNIQDITPDQINSLKIEQIKKKNIERGIWKVQIDKYIRYFSLEQVKAFSLEQLKAISDGYRAKKVFTPEQIAILSLEQLKAFGFNHLTTPNVRVLSSEILQSIPPDLIPRREKGLDISLLTFEQIRALTPEQIESLDFEIETKLTPEHIRWMTLEQIKAIGYNRFSRFRGRLYMTPSQVQVLSKEQIQIFDDDKIFNLGGKHLRVLTYDQLHSFNGVRFSKQASDQVGFDMIKSYEIPDKIAEIQFFKPQKFYYMTYEQGAMMPLESLLLYMLSPERIRAMPYYLEYIKTEEQLKHLSLEKIRAIPPDQISRLTDEKFHWFLSTYRDVINDMTGQYLSSKAIIPRMKLLNSEQISYLNNRYFDHLICMWYLSSAQIYGLPLERINRALDILRGDYKVVNLADYQERPPTDCTAQDWNTDALQFRKKLEKRKLQLETGNIERSSLQLGEVLSLCKRKEATQMGIGEDIHGQIVFPYYYIYSTYGDGCSNMTKKHLSAIKYLYLNNTDFEILPDGELSGLTSLEELFLQNNKLYTLKMDDFRDLKYLKILHLNNNEIQDLPAGIFDHLTNLEELLLYNNQLKSLPKGIFSNLKSLKRLALYNNQFPLAEKKRIIEELKIDGIELEVPAFIKERLSYMTEKYYKEKVEDLINLRRPIFKGGEFIEDREKEYSSEQ